MTRDEHKAITNQLLQMVTPDQQAAASGLLVQLTDDYGGTLDSLERATADAAKLTENNEALRKVNADLFLRVGQTLPINPKETETPNEEQDEPKLTFDALFNEKGDLI